MTARKAAEFAAAGIIGGLAWHLFNKYVLRGAA